MRDDGRDGCLRVLGLEPTASAQEIKAAYRDLAKVWHPDRFAHDPRLQQKAQEQLKEINEAYGRLVSGNFATPHAPVRRDERATYDPHARRPAHAPRPDAAHDNSPRAHATADERVATRPRRGVNRVALAAPALAFCATFTLVTPRLLSTGSAPEQPGDAAAVTAHAREENDEPSRLTADSGVEAREATDTRLQQKAQTTARQHLTEAAGSSAAQPAAQPVRALATVSISIDPTTGLRARPACPNKTVMTFPAGDEPAAYCDAAHNTPLPQRAATDDARAGNTDESRPKSFADRLTSPAKKLFGGRRSPDKEAAREKNAPHD